MDASRAVEKENETAASMGYQGAGGLADKTESYWG